MKIKKSYELYEELHNMVNYIKHNELLKDNYHKQQDKSIIRSFWTVFCLNHNWEPDHYDYDTTLLEIYHDFIEYRKYGWHSFTAFDNYMCEYLC